MFFCVWCGRPSRALWQALLLSGLAGFGTAILVHPAVGYNSVVHVAPACLGALLFAIGMWRTRGWRRGNGGFANDILQHHYAAGAAS